MRFVKVSLVFILAGCVLAGSVFAGIIGKDDDTVQLIAEPMMDNILDGLADENYQKYSKNFDATLKGAIPKEKFPSLKEQIEATFGNYLYREYIGFLNKWAGGGMTVVLWKGVFDKSSDDVLIKMVLTEKEDKSYITGLWFQ